MSAKRRGAPTCIVIVTAVSAACGGPRLSSTEQLAVVVSTKHVSFPDPVEVGKSVTITRAIRFSPAAGTGPSADTITSATEACADFSVVGMLPAPVRRDCAGINMVPDVEPLPAHGGGESDATCQSPTITVADFDVVFHPVTAGPKSCVITFQGTFGQEAVTVSGAAVPPPFAMRVSPSTIDFGDVRVDVDSPAVKITIQNMGSMPLPIDGVSEPGSVFQLEVGPGGGSLGPHTIEVGVTETYTVRCRPAETKSYAGTVRVRSGRVASADVTLACTGTNSQLVGPPELVELSARQGIPIQRAVTIQNVGSAPALISDYQIEAIPELAGELSILQKGVLGSLGVGQTTEVIVAYAAVTERPNMSLGTLVVVQDTAGTKIPIAGEALAAEVGVDPPAIEFGPVCAGRPETRPVRVFANLEGHVNLLEAPGPAAPFSLEADGAPAFPYALAGNQKGMIGFTAGFTPAEPGPVEVTVDLRTDVPKTIRMTGEGLPAGATASPALLDFGALDPDGGIAPGRAILLSNCTGEPLAITGARIEGPHAIHFGIASPQDPRVTIPPYGRAPFLIVLSPGEPGAKQATIVLEHAGGPTRVELAGSTIGASRLRGSYYDCSAGGGAAAPWAIGLALIAVLRRRRSCAG